MRDLSLAHGAAVQPQRVYAVDWLRGLVMLLMLVGHSSLVYNAGRVVSDGVTLYDPSKPLPALQFLMRAMTHLCSPTFLFLSGIALSISVSRRQARGASPRQLDAHLLWRGGLLIALDLVWMSWIWSPKEGLMIGVLYTTGAAILAMIALRRLSTKALWWVTLSLLLGGELICGVFHAMSGPISRFPIAFLFTGAHFTDIHLMITQPLLPWLPALLLGWLCAGWLQREAPWKRFTRLGLASLGVFVVVRALNSYGNMRLLRLDDSFLQFIHVSKYPPSLTYLTLQLGVALLLFALLLWLSDGLFRRGLEAPRWTIVLGQTSLFFYLVHLHLLQLPALSLGLSHSGGIAASWLAAGLSLLLLWPLSARYLSLKERYPRSWLRHI